MMRIKGLAIIIFYSFINSLYSQDIDSMSICFLNKKYTYQEDTNIYIRRNLYFSNISTLNKNNKIYMLCKSNIFLLFNINICNLDYKTYRLSFALDIRSMVFIMKPDFIFLGIKVKINRLQ
ncbi:MAG: hypothetical protein QXF12_00020 [Candidatus Aenigmatarchaeota archaeon]